MSKNVDEFFDLQDVIGNALKSIGGDMDDITGDIVINGDEDVFTMSLYSTVDKKDARNFKKKFFETIEKALSSTRFNDVSRDENYTFAYQLSENDLSNNIGPRAAKEFKDKFAMFEILITAYADREALKESGKRVEVPAPYNKYFEVSDFEPEPEDYQIGEVIEGYDAHLLAYLEVKQEYIEETDIQPVLIDDKDFPVVEIVGSRLIPVNLNAIFVDDDTIDESVEDYIELVDPSLVDKLDFAGAVEMQGNRVYADANTLRQLQDAIDDIAESYEFSDDDFEDDIMHANVYGGDTKYCKHCGELKIWDADGFSYCPECDKDDELTETYWIDNKPVMDKVAELQAELEADGWTQNGDRYTGSKYYSFYMKRGDGKAQWKAIRYSHTDEPEIIDITYRQAIGDEPLDSIEGLRKSLGKMLLPKNESLDANKEDNDDLQESPKGFYVTTYYPDSRWSPEEGGTMDYGWQADKSKFFHSEQEAQEYLDSQLVGMEIKTKYDGSYQYEDEYGDLKMIAIEPSGKRGRWHSPARSWSQIEFDDPVERPYFDRKGSRVERNPRLVAKERKEAAALEKEFRDAVDNATTKEELIEIATDAKFLHVFSKIGSILIDKFHEFDRNLEEASYGGAFDIADDQYFTRDDIEDAAEDVLAHVNETFTEPYTIGGTWFENGTWTVNIQTEDTMEEYEASTKVDMRRIRNPRDLKKYSLGIASDIIKQIKESN